MMRCGSGGGSGILNYMNIWCSGWGGAVIILILARYTRGCHGQGKNVEIYLVSINKYWVIHMRCIIILTSQDFLVG